MAFAVVSPLARVRENAGLDYLFCPDEDLRRELAGLPPVAAQNAQPQAQNRGQARPAAQGLYQQRQGQYQSQYQNQYQTRRQAQPQGRQGGYQGGSQSGYQGQGARQAPPYQAAARASGCSFASQYAARRSAQERSEAEAREKARATASREQSAWQDDNYFNVPVDTSLWPKPWQELFARTKHGPVAWSYYGLGHDLCGNPNKERSRKLGDLLQYLRKPKGTHTFWPVGLPQPDEDGNLVIVADKTVFWQGLHALGARMLIVMGSPAARLIGMEGIIRPLQAMKAINGLRVLLTRDIDHLDDKAFMDTKIYLERTLAPFF